LSFQELLDAASDVVSDWLDKHHGMEVTDNKIFDDLPKLYEDKFHQDMAALNVCVLLSAFTYIIKFYSIFNRISQIILMFFFAKVLHYKYLMPSLLLVMMVIK